MDFSQDPIADFPLHQMPNGDLDSSQHHFNDNIVGQLESAAEAVAVATDEATRALNESNNSNAADEAPEPGDAENTTPARAWLSQSQKGQDVDLSNLVSQKDAVRALRKYTTLTNNEIFRRVGVSSSGGYRYLRGEEKEKETRGRKRKLDETIVNRIILEIEGQPAGEKTKSWEELCKAVGVSGIAPVTLKRAVEGAGYYKCSHCQRVTKVHGMGKDAKDNKEGKEAKESKSTSNGQRVLMPDANIQPDLHMITSMDDSIAANQSNLAALFQETRAIDPDLT